MDGFQSFSTLGQTSDQPGVALALAATSWEVGYSLLDLILFNNLVRFGLMNTELPGNKSLLS